MTLARWTGVVQDDQGNAISGASVEVQDEITGLLPQLYSDRNGNTTIGNPASTDADGGFYFHVVGGVYRIRAFTGTSENPTFERIWRYVGIGTSQEFDIDQVQAALIAGMVIYELETDLQAFTPPSSNQIGGMVIGDPDPAKNGFYVYDDVGTVWNKTRPLPDTMAKVNLSGTASAQTGSLETGVDPASVRAYFSIVTVDNDGPFTLTIAGETPRDVVNIAGNPLSAGEWTAVVMYILNDDGDYQLIIDAGAAASAAQSATDAADTLAEFLSHFLGNYADDTAAATAAGTPVEGQFYWNTTSKVFRFFDGSTWQTFPYATVADDSLTTIKFVDDSVTSAKLADDITIGNTLTVPASASIGGKGLFFGDQGTSRFEMFDLSKNILRGIMQGIPSLHISNGGISAGSINTFGDINIADDDYIEFDPIGWTNSPTIGNFNFDRSGILLLDAPAIVATAAVIQYRISAGTNGEINLMTQALTNVEVNTYGSSAPVVTDYTDGKFTVLVSKPRDRLALVNRRGLAADFTGLMVGHGGGMNK